MWNKIKQAWDENPLQVIAVGASVAVAATAVLNAASSARSRNAYARQINYKYGNR
jgi:hypothetical protein